MATNKETLIAKLLADEEFVKLLKDKLAYQTPTKEETKITKISWDAKKRPLGKGVFIEFSGRKGRWMYEDELRALTVPEEIDKIKRFLG